MAENSGERFIFDEDYAALFKWPEYLVFGSVLVASMGIGVFYGFFNKKDQTNEEFLMAGRQMSVFPVTLSLVCSFVSAITLLGNPVEVYFYGLIFIYFTVSFIPLTLALAYLYLPVFFELQLTSAYEYFEKRFSKRTRQIISATAVVHLLLYMPLTVWGPSLALDQVAGLNKYLTSAVIFIVCIAYSSLGGLKAVLWSDALQAIVMYGTMITVIVVGVNEVGGLSVVWERSAAAGRTDVILFDADPRTRHTFWTGVIASYFSWIPIYAGTQAQIQRYLSVPTMKDARICLWFNMIGLFVVTFLCIFMGLLIYSKYYDCDPTSFDGEVVGAADQLLPLFVMDVLGNYTGIPGLLVAGLTCGSLSTVSSALNALAAIILEDYVKPYKPHLSNLQLGYVSKVISVVGGFISFSLIFVIAAVGDILPFASLLHGTFLGPIVGMFSLGMFFPFANDLGCLLGIIPSLIITLLFGVGSILAENAGDLPNQKLPLRTDGCYLNASRTLISLSDYFTNQQPRYSLQDNMAWKDEEHSGWITFLSVSYLWQPLITVCSTVFFGLLFSFIINYYNKSRGYATAAPIKRRLMTPLIVFMWVKLLGKEKLQNWIDFNEDASTNSIFVKSNVQMGRVI